MKITEKEKEFILSERECPEGYHICPETGECVRIGTRREASKLPKQPTTKELKKNNAEFYAEEMEGGGWGVFDTHSGFCWATPGSKQLAEKKANELNKSLKQAKGMVIAKTKYFKLKMKKYDNQFYKALLAGEKVWVNPEQAKLKDLISKNEVKIKAKKKELKKLGKPKINLKKGGQNPEYKKYLKVEDQLEMLYEKEDTYADQIRLYSIWKWKIDSKINNGKMEFKLTPFVGQHMKNSEPQGSQSWTFVRTKLGWKDVLSEFEGLLKKDTDVLKYIVYWTLDYFGSEPAGLYKIKMPPIKKLLAIINKIPKRQDIIITKGMSTKKIMDFIDTILNWKNVDSETMVALVRHKNIPPEYVSIIFKKVKQFSSAGEDAYKKILKTALSKGVVGEKEMARILSDILTML